jgi:hypothetical protein
MSLKAKIVEVFKESIGGLTGFDPKTETTPALQRHKDVHRKRVDRQGEQRENKIKRAETEKKALQKGIEPPHPRTYLQNELRLSLKETFAAYLVEYLNTDKPKYMVEALNLMEEYPALKKYVQEMSHAALPQQSFSVFHAREHHDQEIGAPAYRSGSNAHNWCLTRHQALANADHLDHPMLMEAKVSPEKTLIYIPAFTKLMEEIIFSGKIEEPQENVIRKAKNKNEIILPPSVDTGMIVEIKK